MTVRIDPGAQDFVYGYDAIAEVSVPVLSLKRPVHILVQLLILMGMQLRKAGVAVSTAPPSL